MKDLPPAYFALVMATGIVSIAAGDFHLPLLATALFVLNLVAYAVLAVLTVLRAVRYPRLFFGDMTDHRLGPGFFTAVAGSCILGRSVPADRAQPGSGNLVPGAGHRALDRPHLHDLHGVHGQA